MCRSVFWRRGSRNVAVRPKLQALVVADHVYRDHFTGKHVIAGTFNQINVTQLPGFYGKDAFVYMSLADVRTEIELELRIVKLKGLEVLGRSHPFKTESAMDPLMTLEVVVQLPPIPVPELGSYALEVHWESEMLGSHRFTVKMMEEVK